MKRYLAVVSLFSWAASSVPHPVLGAEKLEADTSDWHIKDVCQYLGAMRDELSEEDVARYCRSMIDCQDPKTGNFVDKHGEFVYSAKAYHTLESHGYEPKYPVGCHYSAERSAVAPDQTRLRRRVREAP